MKKVINVLLNQRKIIIPFMVGVIVMGGISYGVNQIQSSSVSYTRDGKVMSVEQAIDDLIVKVNKKNEQISVPIDAGKTLKLKADLENVTWESSNKDVATVDSNGLVTAKTPGTAKITVKNGNISSSVNVTVVGEYLADVVEVGDYVAYDAGSWTSSAGKPTSHGQFGGYTKDQNKANSVSCAQSTTLKGWRVLKIDSSTKTVTLVHAGQPECYYHGSYTYYDGDQSRKNLNNRATSTYLNSNYADSAHNMNHDEALAITGNKATTDNNLRKTGAAYWLDESTADNGCLYAVYHDGAIDYIFPGGSAEGIRPVVVLKSKILTTGKERDYVGQEAWTLVKP